MGHEKKILLTLLCLLSGTFVGVLSAKLLIPRPPAGAGPDVHDDAVVAASHEIVEPPALSDRPAPPLAIRDDFEDGDPPLPAAPAVAPPVPVPTSRFATSEIDIGAAAEPPVVERATRMPDELPESVARRDPFVARAAVEEPVAPAERGVAADTALPSPVGAGGYVTVAGDSWWSLAERAYGDGRLYRALFAWNRAIDPRISLVPGTRLDVPPRQRLESSSPNLIPAE